MLATSGFLTALECTKVVFGQGSALAGPRWGSLLRPRPPSWFKGDPTSKGMEGERRGGARLGPCGTTFLANPV